MDSLDLSRFLTQQDIQAQIIYLSAETPTVETAARSVGCRPEQIGKSILFIADGRPLLVVANGTTHVDQRRLAAHLGLGKRRVKLANAAQVMAFLGYPVGTVPPFGHKAPLPTIIEAGVLVQEELYCGGGAVNALMRITTAELRRILQAEVVEVAAA